MFEFNRQIALARGISLKAPDEQVEWTDVLQVLLTAQLTKDGPTNLTSLPEYFNTVIAGKLLDHSPGLIKRTATDLKGETPAEEFVPGQYVVIVARRSTNAFRVWMLDAKVQKDQLLKINLADVGRYPPTFDVDVTRK